MQARIFVVEDFQKAINETITEQHDRVRHLSEIQTATQATFQGANLRTQSAIRNMASDFRRFQDEIRYIYLRSLTIPFNGKFKIY